MSVVNLPHAATSGPDGRFTIANVPAGTYDLQVYRQDFIGRAVQGVTLTAGATTDIGDITITPGVTGWSTHAIAFRGQIGERITYFCPPGGSMFSIWGTDINTDDSAVCVAGVHVGLITFASGGAVTFEMAPGQPSYVGSFRYGVQSLNWGSWSSSFIFPYANP